MYNSTENVSFTSTSYTKIHDAALPTPIVLMALMEKAIEAIKPYSPEEKDILKAIVALWNENNWEEWIPILSDGPVVERGVWNITEGNYGKGCFLIFTGMGNFIKTPVKLVTKMANFVHFLVLLPF